MAVVTHGSFDEDIITLKLPDIFKGLVPDGIQTETDPLFSAWDRSTGVSITKKQITDRSDIVTTDGADSTANLVDILDSYVTGANLMEVVETGYVPYVNASGNVDLGDYTLDADRVYVNHETPIASTELATKGYVDATAFTAIGGVTPTVAHNDTTSKEGGGGGHWYHLSDTANAVIPNITTSGSDIVPTGLTLSDSGISIGLDGLAWVELTWDAIVSSTFDHYVIEYKKSAYTYYTPLIATSNHIMIEGLTPNTSYNFRIASVNKYGTASAFSTDLILTTPSDSVAPATVSGLTTTAAIQAILLRWTHNTDVDLESYNIYRNTANDTASSTIVANFKGNVYMDNGLTANTTYYYWLKAKDTSGNLSAAFSTGAYATTRNVLATDIENIAANQVIIQGVTTLANWTSPGVTTIDGAKITTGSITLSQLNFTPLAGGNIIASINASPEGIQIEADNFAVSGSSVFTAKVGGSFTSANTVPRIRIFPDSDTGIEVVDDRGRFSFRALIGGTNVGDVIIGDWANGQGFYYDSSAGTYGSTSFAGTIMASAGNIGGWSISGTALIKENGTSSVGMSPSDYPFYAGNTYANRSNAPFRVTSEGNVTVLNIKLSNASTNTILRTYSNGNIVDSSMTDDGDRVRITTPSGLVIPRLYFAPTSPEPGMIYYNASNGHAYLYTNTWRVLD
jgi:hypothetical protein